VVSDKTYGSYRYHNEAIVETDGRKVSICSFFNLRINQRHIPRVHLKRR
jgi:hypothetical protein